MKDQKNYRCPMPQGRRLIGGAVLGLAMIVSAPVWASVLYQEDFESSTIGATPAGWNVLDQNNGFVNITGSQTANANVWVQAAPSPQAFNGAQALNYVGNSATVQPFGWITSIPASDPSSNVIFSFDFYLQPSAATQPTNVRLAAASQTGIYVEFAANGTSVDLMEPYVYGSSSSLSISPNTWYHANLALAPLAVGTVTLTLTDASNNPVGSPLSWFYSAPQMGGGFKNITVFEPGGPGLGVNNFYDNFLLIEIIPEPSTVLLLGVGGLLLWRRRNR